MAKGRPKGSAKVVDIYTGQEVYRAGRSNDAVVRMCRDLCREAESGQLAGFVAIGIDQNQCTHTYRAGFYPKDLALGKLQVLADRILKDQ